MGGVAGFICKIHSAPLCKTSAVHMLHLFAVPTPVPSVVVIRGAPVAAKKKAAQPHTPTCTGPVYVFCPVKC